MKGAGKRNSNQSGRRIRWAELCLLTALALYTVLAVLAFKYAYFSWDLNLALAIQSISTPGFDALMKWISFIGESRVGALLILLSGWLFWRFGYKKEAWICSGGVAAGALLNQFLKTVIARPRPHPDLVLVLGEFRHESFPSGHVAFFVEFFGFLMFLAYIRMQPGLIRTLTIGACGLLVSIVGVSRVYLGAHWPSDVVGAYLAAGLWLALMIEVYRRVSSR